MDLNLKAVVRYNGTHFAGWQIQPDERTVQGELEAVLSRIASRPIRVHGASRTDSGVHAFGQVCSFRWPEECPHDRLRRSLSGLLSPEIRVEDVAVVPESFHARKSAIGKRYAYAFHLGKEPDPFGNPYAWCIRWPVDLDLLAELAKKLEGEHDFAGFQSAGTEIKSTVRALYSVELRRGGVVAPLDAEGLWRIEFHGTGFLYKMVRNITGTLVDIARGHFPASRLDELLTAPSPFMGYTAPAHGLTLLEVLY
jgi:tRNA pseudouridine38-40 synthase